jgi:hypothetical protein
MWVKRNIGVFEIQAFLNIGVLRYKPFIDSPLDRIDSMM